MGDDDPIPMVSSARSLMQTEVHTVGPDMTLADLERAFLSNGVSGFPVVEGERLVGIVARSDIVRLLSVEQSTGEILSEYHREFGGGESNANAASDIVASQLASRLGALRVRDVMITKVVAVSPDTPLTEVARTLVEARIHRVPVVEGEGLVGIVSSLDFARCFAEGSVAPAR
jgi:CBS domain-containing protein